MAADLKGMLSEDISNNLNHDLYRKNAVQVQPQYLPTEQDWREMDEIIAQAEKEQRRQEYRDPLPEDYAGRLTQEDMDEIDAAVDAVRKGKWDEFAATRPYINGNTGKTEVKPQTPKPTPPVEQQPVISLYDLFGFSEEERKQTNTQKRGKKKPASTQGKPVQFNLFSQPQVQPDTVRHSINADNNRTNVVYPVFDVRKEELDRQRRELEKPSPYSGILQEHHRQGSLVTEQNGQTGFLKERYRDDAIFKSLELNPLQEQKAKLYIEIRDTYHSLLITKQKNGKKTQTCGSCSTSITIPL
jgi:hypothetical protein